MSRITLPSDLVSALIQAMKIADDNKLHSANLMIRYRFIVQKMNNHIESCLHHIYMLNGKKESYRIKHKISRYTSDIRSEKAHLVFYTSSWYIYIRQNIVSKSDARANLGDFLTNEYLLLKTVLDYWSSDRGNSLFNDSLICRKFFKECAKIGNGDDR